MDDRAALNGLAQDTLEDKFSALEAKFAALEKKYQKLHEKTFTLTENSTGKSTEIDIAQVYSTTNNKNILVIETWLSLAASLCQRNDREGERESGFAIKHQLKS